MADEVAALRDRVQVLEAENARLTEQLAHARAQLMSRRREGADLTGLDRPPTAVLRASSAYARTFGGGLAEPGELEGIAAPDTPAPSPAPVDGSLCPNCGRAIPADNMSKHQLHCMRNIARCPHCAEALPMKEVEAHLVAARGSRADMESACSSGDLERLAKMVAHGANVEEAVNDIGDPPLHCACRSLQLPVIMWLFDHGVPLNSKNARGESALHVIAAIKGQSESVYETCAALVARGADVASVNIMGDSPLNAAQRAGNHGIALLLTKSGSSLRSLSRGTLRPGPPLY